MAIAEDWKIAEKRLERHGNPDTGHYRKEAFLTLVGKRMPDELVVEIEGTPIRFERISLNESVGKAEYVGTGPVES